MLAGQSPARRTVAGAPTTLPGRPSTASYRLRLTGARTSATGTLQLSVRAGVASVRVEATTDDDGAVLVELAARDGAVTVERGGRTRAGRAQDAVPEHEGVVAWTEEGQFRLDAVQWQDLGTAADSKKPTEEARARKSVKDPGERLTVGSRWTGRITGTGRDQDCTLVVLESRADTLSFRLELESGARFRFVCLRKLGQLAVKEIVHTRAASGGQKRGTSEERGHGTVADDKLTLDYSYRSSLPKSYKTMTGTIRVQLT